MSATQVVSLLIQALRLRPYTVIRGPASYLGMPATQVVVSLLNRVLRLRPSRSGLLFRHVSNTGCQNQVLRFRPYTVIRGPASYLGMSSTQVVSLLTQGLRLRPLFCHSRPGLFFRHVSHTGCQSSYSGSQT